MIAVDEVQVAAPVEHLVQVFVADTKYPVLQLETAVALEQVKAFASH